MNHSKRLTISREAYTEAEREMEKLYREARARTQLDEKVIALIDKARSADPPLEYRVIYDMLVKKELIDAEAIPTRKRLNYLYNKEKNKSSQRT